MIFIKKNKSYLPKSYLFSENKWPSSSANLIFNKIKKIHKLKKVVNICLTGGSTSLLVYFFLAKKLFFYKKKINFFLGDERFTKNKNKTNVYHIKKIFKKYKNILHNFRFYNINNKILNEKKNYNIILKKSDILLLTLGDDGHIASIFSNNKKMNTIKKKLIIVKRKNENFKRISITMNYILKSNNIFLFIYGKKKLFMYNKIINNISYCPAAKIIKKCICIVQKKN